MRPLLIAAAFILWAGPGLAQVCVENGDQTALLFVAEARGGDRVVSVLDTGESLCTPGDRGGVVSVFTDEDVLEGCSRLVPAGTRERLVKYADFDRCRWASHDGG